MSCPIAALVCPGRGSYNSTELGFLHRTLRDGPTAEAVALADRERHDAGEPTITELDGAERFRPSLHLDGQNAAELIYLSTMAHCEQLQDRYEIACVAGNSLGWYTALAAAGALSASDGWRLVRALAQLQSGVRGGQVLTSTIDESWRVDPEQRAAVARAIADTRAAGDDHFVAPSIHLGGHEVVAGTEAGIRRLLELLPRRSIGGRDFPFQLAGHGPFHTALCRPVAEAAPGRVAELDWRAPRHWLIDGLGNAHSPWSTAPRHLLAYTTTTQVTETFDFTASVRTAIREFQPDVLVCAGPGESLRAPVGHVVIDQHFRGIRDRDSLFASRVVATG